jgi:ParB-like chromosome segregation protein Spo0J
MAIMTTSITTPRTSPAAASDPGRGLAVVADAVGPDVDSMTAIERLPDVSVPISLLVPGFHLRREGTDAAHVRLLADAAGSVQLPPILVQRNGSRVIDGLHRIEVAKLRGERNIRARIVDCTDKEALVLAVRSNTLHGLPLSRTDRIASAKMILAAHADWSDRAVAGITGLSAKSVASLRNSATGGAEFAGKRLGRDGKRRPLAPAEGRRRAAEYITAHPEASLRQIARETDVSLGTVHDVRDKLRRGADYAAGPVAPQPAQTPVSLRVAGRPAPDRGPATRPAAAPALVQAIHSVAGVRRRPAMAWPMVSSKLASDPSLRYTEGGRAFLRWMAGHSMQADEWREFIDAIPQHWVRDVFRIAAGMSEEWRLFAERLENKLETAS